MADEIGGREFDKEEQAKLDELYAAMENAKAICKDNVTDAIIHITEKLHKETASYFNTQEARGTSFVDCSSVVTMKMLKIPQIFSFDKAYSKQFGVEMVT